MLSSWENCPRCGGTLKGRREFPYPVFVTALFGISFAAFLALQNRFMPQFYGDRAWPKGLLWTWCVLQIILGGVLVFQRRRAQRIVYHCIRCGADLPSKH